MVLCTRTAALDIAARFVFVPEQHPAPNGLTPFIERMSDWKNKKNQNYM